MTLANEIKASLQHPPEPLFLIGLCVEYARQPGIVLAAINGAAREVFDASLERTRWEEAVDQVICAEVGLVAARHVEKRRSYFPKAARQP